MWNDLTKWLERWDLTPDGKPFRTPYTGSLLSPVKQGSALAMLKVARAPEEVRGAALMRWWDGDGAAPVLAQEGAALLLARARSVDGLAPMARDGRDEAATGIICDTVERLHAPRNAAAPPLVPLRRWFEALEAGAPGDPRLAAAWGIAATLLTSPQDVVVLHGDIHHQNILDFGDLGWLAIDPKGLVGERGYDYANLFRNPDIETALEPGRLAARLEQVSARVRLDPNRQIRWVIAHAALSASWAQEDRRDASWSLAVLDAALALLRP